MEIRQFECLIAAVEHKSFNKAAEKLYTSQSNISKSIKNLEERLNLKILERTSRGVYLTTAGKKIYEQANNIMNIISQIDDIARNSSHETLRITCYYSQPISSKLIDYYKSSSDPDIHIDFHAGNISEIINDLKSYNYDIGIVFYSSFLKQSFNGITDKGNLVFQKMADCGICVYLGKNHPLYANDTITFEELRQLKFVQESRDYYSIISQLNLFSKGRITANDIDHVIHINVGHTIIGLLEETDLCNIGLDVRTNTVKNWTVKKVKIEDCEDTMSVGYLMRNDYELTVQEKAFLAYVESLFV